METVLLFLFNLSQKKKKVHGIPQFTKVYLSFVLSLVFSLIFIFLVLPSFSFLLPFKFWSGTDFACLDFILLMPFQKLFCSFFKKILLLQSIDCPSHPTSQNAAQILWILIGYRENNSFPEVVKKIYKAKGIHKEHFQQRMIVPKNINS